MTACKRHRLHALRRVLPGLALSACTAAPGDMWVSETTARGDTTVVRTVSGSVWGGGASLVEEVRIGALEGAEEELFGDVFRLAEDGAGGVYVLDRQGPVLRRYDGAGNYLGQIGRAGEGPGEYSWMSLGLAVEPDGDLIFHDFGNSRLTRFSGEGEPLNDWPLPSTMFSTLPDTWLFADAPDLLVIKTRIDLRPAFITVRHGAPIDTLLVPQLPGMPDVRGGPYGVNTYWTRLPNGAVVVGVSARYSFEIHAGDGVLRVEREMERLPVRPEEAEEWTARFEWMERQPQYRPPQGEWIPSEMPPYRGLYPGRDGRIWVRRNVPSVPVEVTRTPDGPPPVGWAQPFVYDVFDGVGRYLGEIRFPDRFEPLIFGDGTVWGVLNGEFDEEYVVRLRLVAPTV